MSGGASSLMPAGMARATVALHGDLTDFLTPLRRDLEVPGRGIMVQRHFEGHPAVKDLLEATGVPHPEIAAITVNDAPAGFGQRLHDGCERNVSRWLPLALRRHVCGAPPRANDELGRPE